MRITLVVPGLLALPSEALARISALSRLAALATVESCPDLDTALLADLNSDLPPAPLAALGAGLDLGQAWVVRADPVALVVGRNDVRLAGFAFDLDEAERGGLIALFNAHFAEDGLAFAAPRADAWFASSATTHEIATTSVDAIGGKPLRDRLPTGRDAARWRRWLTEAQMLLHDHPLARREGTPVHGLWFSGGGALIERAPIAAFDARAAEGRYGDVLRGLAQVARRVAAPVAPLADVLAKRTTDSVVVALAPIESAGDLEPLACDFLEPALDALLRASASAVKLIASGDGNVASWSAARASWLARLFPQQRPFVTPDPGWP